MSTRSRRLGKRTIAQNSVEQVVVDDGEDKDAPVRSEELVLSHYHLINPLLKTHASSTFNPEHVWLCRGSLEGIKEVYRKVSSNVVVKQYLEGTGWKLLFVLDFPKPNHSVSAALMEHWWDNTHTFHFPHCELGITPLDFTTLTDISIGEGPPPPFDDRPYTNFEATKELYFKDCETLKSVKDNGIPLVQFS